jgi:catechol 2,3-dioxygenase-like lactoylglutathione lyase family enzyme
MRDSTSRPRASRVVPNISSTKPEETAEFFVSLLGFEIAMDMHSVITLTASDNFSAQINILRIESGASIGAEVQHAALQPPQISIDVSDVDLVYQMAKDRDLDIRYPLTDEDWGVRRFFVAEPNGLTINILSHN